MTFFPRLYLKVPFEVVDIAGEVMAVSVGDCTDIFSGTILLKNESTRFMFEKLQEEITLPELIKACMEEYTDSSVEEVGPQVLKFLDMLKEKGLLAADAQRGIREYGDGTLCQKN